MPINYPDDCECECDGCGKSITLPLSEYAGEPRTIGLDEESLDAVGWSLLGGDEVLCPECAEEDEEDL